jgi:hypothetical protein
MNKFITSIALVYATFLWTNSKQTQLTQRASTAAQTPADAGELVDLSRHVRLCVVVSRDQFLAVQIWREIDSVSSLMNF